MGVTGLWRLIEPAGKPVPVETLENKVLAVDISIWLHQMVKGYQDAKGAPLPNAHLVGLFQRLCKLLYFRVKPVFVFDGGFPDLKKETIAKRQDNKTKYNSESERIKRELALLLNKKTAIGSLLGKQISPKKSTAGTSKASSDDDIFKLPALPVTEESDTESEDEESSSGSIVDLHSIDVESDNFKKLSVKEKYDLLIELKETRKMNSWGKLHELPKKSDNFSDFQMQRLLKRRKVQECLEETEKEMGDTGMSLTDLESLLNAEGIDTKIEALPTRRIASNNSTRFILINNVKQALADVKKKKQTGEQADTNIVHDDVPKCSDVKDQIEKNKKDELEDDLQKAIKMSLECVDDHDSSAYASKTDDSWTSYLSDSDHSPYDSEEEDGFEPPDMTSAKAYILQYCDFTNKAVDEIVSSKNYKSNKHKGKKVARIIEELNKEKSIITDEVEISSEEEEYEENADSNNKKIVTDSSEDISSKKNMDNTQSSVVSIENPRQEVVTLDTNTENYIQENPIKAKEMSIKMETALSDDDEQFEDIPEAQDFSSSKALMDNTQASVICLDNSTQEVINLDTSIENDVEQSPINKDKAISLNIGSESSDEDQEFEDVSETESTNKPVVELTLNMDVMSDDDIFADVFDKRVTNTTETDFVSSQNKKYSDTLPIGEDKSIKNDNKKEANKNEQNKLEIIEKETTINKDNTNIANTCTPNNEKIDSDCKTHIAHVENENSKLSQKASPPEISTETLNSMVTEVESQEQVLLEEKGRLDRIGRNITEQMTKEAQELLQIFGIPYIVAPMEAEAQCAFLEAVKLTDGTITDDSDIWLFGGKTVYKNFFNQKKHVSQFLAERIEKSFNLTREQLVLLALLVGSDYTTGLTGVGPVTALEILATFPFNKKLLLSETSNQGRYRQIITGLQEFKKWVRTGKRTDDTSLKKKLKNVAVTDDFPSLRVVQAYLEPNVEKSEEKFTWGEIDITIIRDYAKAKFGWSQNKLDEIIKPVLKRLEERKTQKNIKDYFKKKIEFQSLEEHLSKRVKAAVQRMDPELSQEASISSELKTKTGRKRKTNKKKVNEGSAETTAGSGPSQIKLKKYSDEESALGKLGVKVVSTIDDDGKSTIQITIPKSDRVQEIIPQREKDKKCLLQNKMKAIELFRKSKLDPKNKTAKRKVVLPKEKAELSESDSE